MLDLAIGPNRVGVCIHDHRLSITRDICIARNASDLVLSCGADLLTILRIRMYAVDPDWMPKGLSIVA